MSINNNNKTKMAQLGMPIGTAQNRLKKMILFKLVQEAGKDICFKCKKQIKSVEDFSIEHKIPWLHRTNAKKMYWDLNNIAFSHFKCNVRERERTKRPYGKEWCCGCKTFLNIEQFHKNKNNPSGVQHYCKNCRQKNRKL